MNYAIEHGIIDVDEIRKRVQMERRKELLERHPYKVWQDKDGRWNTYLETKTGRVLKRRTTRAALDNDIYEHELKKETFVTIEDSFVQWNDWKLELGKICEATYYRNKNIFNRFYKEFGQRYLNEVRDDEFRDFLEMQIPKYHLTARDFANLKTITRGLLKWAKRKGYIEWNYDYMLTNIEVSKRDFKKVIKEDVEEVYSEEETKKVLDYLIANQDQTNLGLLLIFVTGIRVGELSTLKVSDIKEDYIQIRRTESTWVKDGKRVNAVKDFPKSMAGWRDVVLPTEYTWILTKLISMNPHGEYLFERGGKRRTEQVFQHRIRRVCSSLGIVVKSPHKIRKTYSTILLDNSVDANLILQQMGHSSIATTERHYHRNRKSVERKQVILDSLPEFSKK